MKSTKTVFSLLLLTACLLLSCTIKAQEQKFTLTENGIGPVKKGGKLANLPARFKGLYDKIEKIFIEDDYDGNSDQYTFYLGGKETMIIMDYGSEFTVNALASNITTPNGIYPGMDVKDLLKKNVSFHGHMATLVYDNYIINVEFSESGSKKYNDYYSSPTPSNPTITVDDFVPNAKVHSISFGL